MISRGGSDEVFRDRPLASHIRQVESEVADEDPHLIADAVSQAIRARDDALPG
jgi:hypothetical protein